MCQSDEFIYNVHLYEFIYNVHSSGTDMGIKCVRSVMQRRSAYCHNISYTAISIKVVTETIVKCAIWVDDGNNHSFK